MFSKSQIKKIKNYIVQKDSIYYNKRTKNRVLKCIGTI